MCARARIPLAVKAIGKALVDGGRVYVHCTAGMGRAPSAAIAFLYWVRNMDLDEARAYVAEVGEPSHALHALMSADALMRRMSQRLTLDLWMRPLQMRPGATPDRDGVRGATFNLLDAENRHYHHWLDPVHDTFPHKPPHAWASLRCGCLLVARC